VSGCVVSVVRLGWCGSGFNESFSLLYRPDIASADLGQGWPGEFYCPCHGSKFDLAGRVFKNVPAPLNLLIPRYRYLSDTRMKIGEDTPAK